MLPLKKQCKSRIYKSFRSCLYLVFIRYKAPRSRLIRFSFLRKLGYNHSQMENRANKISEDSTFGKVDDLYRFRSMVERKGQIRVY